MQWIGEEGVERCRISPLGTRPGRGEKGELVWLDNQVVELTVVFAREANNE
jgi:hypothetical protein